MMAMIQHPAFTVEPWSVRETALHPDVLTQSESLFALANGHIGLRGNLDEGGAVRPAGHLPERLSRAAAAAVRRAGLR
jgi:trehalose/maltose hydrolase-like predicted phosphorylase